MGRLLLNSLAADAGDCNQFCLISMPDAGGKKMSSVLYEPDLKKNSSPVSQSVYLRVCKRSHWHAQQICFLLCYTFRSCDHCGVEAESELLRKFSLLSLIDEICFYAFCQRLAHELWRHCNYYHPFSMKIAQILNKRFWRICVHSRGNMSVDA